MCRKERTHAGSYYPSRKAKRGCETRSIQSLGVGIAISRIVLFNMNKEFEKALSHSELRKAAKSCRKGVNHKDSVKKYDLTKLLSNERLAREIREGTYSISPYAEFTITEPKIRHIEASKYRDRVWQRSMTENGVRKYMEKSFIYDNGACQKNKGTDQAICRVIYFLQDYYRRHGTNKGYIEHLDIKGYYPNTPHEVAKRVVRERLPVPEFADHVCMIIDSCKDRRPSEEIEADPFGPRGILLGSEIMQVVQLSIPDKIDHYIKEELKMKYYIRFNDDFLTIHQDKEKVEEASVFIKEELKKLGLQAVSKGGITPLNKPFKYLRKRFILTDTGKVIIRLDQKEPGRERRRLQKMKKKLDEGTITMDAIRIHYQDWSASASKCTADGMLRKMDKYYAELFNEAPERRKKHAYPRSKRANQRRKKKE